MLYIFYDLSKALDMINHELPQIKLLKYGICGVALDWITTYLSDRTRSVRICGNGTVKRG